MIVRLGDEDFPFCSDRCRKIDLGKWAMGVYKISSPVLDPEVLEDLGGLGDNRGGDSDEELTSSSRAAASKTRTATKSTWAWAVATFFGAGYLKPGPGTWGSIAAVLLWAAVGVLVHPLPRTRCSLGLLVWHRARARLRRSRRHHRRARKRPPRSRLRRHRRSHRPMDRPALQPRRLASRPHRSRPLSPLRYHQAVSRAPTRAPSRGLGHRLRRCGRRAVCFGYSVAVAHLVLTDLHMARASSSTRS